MKTYDVVIVGGGFAGLSAALLLGRSRRRVLVSDTGKTRNAVAQESHGFFTRDGATPAELVRIGREQLRPYETVELCSVGVKSAKAHSKGFEITLDDETRIDRKSTRLNSSHLGISYAVFCLKKKNTKNTI